MEGDGKEEEGRGTGDDDNNGKSLRAPKSKLDFYPCH